MRTAQERYEVVFPPDLGAVLERGLPVATPDGRRFPNWRALDVPNWMGDLRHGILFDVERWFWLGSWGDRPESTEDALALASEKLQDVPMLVPVFGHRFMPMQPGAPANPVLSVVQTDVIYYGWDLKTYFSNEFAMLPPKEPPTEAPFVPFWSDIVVQNRLRMPSSWAPGP